MVAMAGKKAQPLSRETIYFIDTFLAKGLLVVELCQIPEFIALWQRARQTVPTEVMEIALSHLNEIFGNLSPEALGALLMGEGAHLFYDQVAISQAEEAAMKLHRMSIAVDDALKKARVEVSYRADLENLVKPLGVPNLVDIMIVLDFEQWGVINVLRNRPVGGFLREYLEATLLKEFTGLGLLELATESKSRLEQRVRRRIAPLSRHLKRYYLRQRIQLWVRNVVYGEPIRDIASRLQDDLQRARDAGYLREEWVKRQIREASKILEVKRPPGRPPKGGVLRVWKLMCE